MKDLRHKFHKVQEVNQKMSESVADCHAEIRDLSLAVKNLELENIQQKKLIEDMVKRTAREIKSVEGKMLRFSRAEPLLSRREKILDTAHTHVRSTCLARSIVPKQNDDIFDS